MHRALEQADKRYFWHPFTQMKEYESLPSIIIDRAYGVYLYDTHGCRYLDGIASWWVNVLGHRHPRLDHALKAQIERFSHVSTATITHEPAIKLAQALTRVAPPGLTRVFYSDDGSTAVETALKMVYQAWQNRGETQRTKFVSLEHGYHGDTLGAVSVGDVAIYHALFKPLLFPVYHAPSPALCLAPPEIDEAAWLEQRLRPLEAYLEAHGSEVAGLILEPLVQAAAGMYIYPPAYLRRVRALCDAYRIPLIADEVATGFGRTGKMFACEHAGIRPDVLCLSKALTGGYMPMGVTIATDELFEAFYGDYKERRTFFHGHSYTGNPLGCALALEVLQVFREERIVEALAPRIAALQEAFAAFRELPWVGDIRGIGMIAAIDLVADAKTRAPFPTDQRIGYRICQEALKRGLYIRPLGDVLYLLPPLVIDADEIRWSVGIMREAITTVLG